MHFDLTTEQHDFATALQQLLAGEDTVGAARAWAAGDFSAGQRIWKRLSDQGVSALLVPEAAGGMGASHVELVLALEAIGRAGLPGPWVESIALLAQAHDPAGQAAVADGALHTACVPGLMPHAVDVAAASAAYCVSGSNVEILAAAQAHQSIDPARALTPCEGTGDIADDADSAILGTAAQLLGIGERLLGEAVSYVGQRKQFGRAIGSYQAIKHQLADVRVALDFARPLVWGAAVNLDARSASAAKIGAGEAAQKAMRTALQVHGAIGYTRELDLSIWLLKACALQSAWGTADWHRNRVAGLIGVSA